MPEGGTLYAPWGRQRYASGTTPTAYRFTGQREESSIGIYFYGARFYDPQLGRWIQPDTIVPQSQGVQAFDRFAYVSNNPLRYLDPTGHWRDEFGDSRPVNSYMYPAKIPVCSVPSLNDPSADIHRSFTASLTMNSNQISGDESIDDRQPEFRLGVIPHRAAAFEALGVINYQLLPFANAALLDAAQPNVSATVYYDLYYDEQTGHFQTGIQNVAFWNNSGEWFDVLSLDINDFKTNLNRTIGTGYNVVELNVPNIDTTFSPADITFTFYSPSDYDSLFDGRSWFRFRTGP
ncbi:MAG TPA: RHS repeat-associated core domain-containing protein [Anaerolineales bacterium]|nr:RHS repeat-associated core domain-containing protein [Anaerolineales bacterium]